MIFIIMYTLGASSLSVRLLPSADSPFSVFWGVPLGVSARSERLVAGMEPFLTGVLKQKSSDLFGCSVWIDRELSYKVGVFVRAELVVRKLY